MAIRISPLQIAGGERFRISAGLIWEHKRMIVRANAWFNYGYWQRGGFFQMGDGPFIPTPMPAHNGRSFLS